MNKSQENSLSMYEAVLAVLDGNKDLVQAIPAFAAVAGRFRETVLLIKQKDSEKRTVSAGKTKVKAVARKALTAAILPITMGLKAVAIGTQDIELKARTKLTKSTLDRMRDTELASMGGDVFKLATQHQEALAAFLITAEQVAELRAKVDAYQAALSTREGSAAQRVSATSTLAELFKEATVILNEELATMVGLYNERNPDFVKTYKAARVTRNLGVRHKAVDEEVGSV